MRGLALLSFILGGLPPLRTTMRRLEGSNLKLAIFTTRAKDGGHTVTLRNAQGKIHTYALRA